MSFSTSNNSNDSDLSTNFIAPLDYYGLVGVEGPDTASFLQGQTTCDIREVNDQHSVHGAYCSVKGRVLGNFQCARTNSEHYLSEHYLTEHYLLRMNAHLVSNTINTLSKYSIFSKTKLYDASGDYRIFGLYGDKASSVIKSVSGGFPQGLFDTFIHEGNITIQLDQQGQRFECWVKAEQAEQYCSQLSKNLSTVDSNVWELLNIREGACRYHG